jgi:hypothetical protein
VTAEDGGWDIGGYVPAGYEVTPWTTLFPALARVPNSPTFRTSYMAKLYTYYFTRLQFGQYLNFLSDVGPEICRNDAISDDARVYGQHCERLLESIEQAAASNPLDQEGYEFVVKSFDEQLLNPSTSSERFFSSTVYKAFFAGYGFFTNCAYGFVALTPNPYRADDGWYYYRPGDRFPYDYDPTRRPSGRPKTNPFSILPMLADAMRFYPVIARDGSATLAYFGGDHFHATSNLSPSGRVLFADLGQHGDWRQPDCQVASAALDEDGFTCHELRAPGSGAGPVYLRLYPVSHSMVPDTFEGSIRGLPMIFKMPFEVLTASAAGSTAMAVGR